jgi:hypothetical protein
MKELEAPVKDALRKTTTPASVARMWGRIEVRGRGRARAGAGRRPWVLVAAVVGVASAAFGGGAVVWRSSPADHGAPVPSLPADHGAPAPRLPPVADPSPRFRGEGSEARPTEESKSEAPGVTPRASWRDLASRGDNAQAYAALGAAGVASAARSASVDDLFALADVARLSGHASEARLPLERIVAEHPKDGRAPLAALTLGRVELRALGQPQAASEALAKAIALGLPRGIAEEAYALLVEARGTAGDRAGARAAFAEYTARFPEEAKARADTLRRWVDGP